MICYIKRKSESEYTQYLNFANEMELISFIKYEDIHGKLVHDKKANTYFLEIYDDYRE